MKKMQHPKENGTSSPAKETAVVRKERRVIRTTSNEDGKKVEKIVESVKRSFPKRSNTIEDEVVDLPVETTQPCIVPQTISTAASELFAKSAPTIRPINDSSEVIVVYDEKPPEEHLGGFLGELAATATERKDIIDQAAALKGVMMDQMESALTKAATDDEQHATGGKGAKNGLDGSEDNSHFADGNSKAESKLEVHTSLNATSEEQFDGRKHSLEVERTFDQSDSNNKIPSGEGSELSIGCSPQRTSPEQEAKLVLVSETKASTDLEHSPGQHAQDQQQSSQYSPIHSEVILSVHENMHSTEGVVRPQDDSTHSSERIAGPIREGSSEDNTRSILESIHSDDGAQSMHESVHSTEGIRSIHDTDNSPHSEAGPIRETMNVTEGMYSSHESVHSPQEGVLFVQQSTHPAEGTAHSVSGDAHTLDDLTRSVHGSIHPAGNDTHPEHHSSHSNEDTPSSQPREDSFPKTEHPLEDQSYTEVTSRSVEHSDIHCSDSTVHSPGIHVEQSHVVDSSPGYEFTSGYDIERRSPDQGSYFVKSSRFEIGESRGDTDENSDEEAHAFRTTTGSKFSEEAIRLQRSEASLKERVEENIEEGEDVSVI
ncbi:hypothetical protein Tcan_13319 [Toxocara canis]|uniref:Uncharacterized protein n=1 Tax=Toxocara canis TaxID=6265 RepID=A0A0B2VTM9_TOXCA|nr:hypothetical protein Tcan_13319 [Toxocara canis]